MAQPPLILVWCEDRKDGSRYTSWARWTALVMVMVMVMLAHAFLTVTAADQTSSPADSGLIPRSRNVIAYFRAVLLMSPTHPPAYRWAWSI